MTHQDLLYPTPITKWDRLKYWVTERLYTKKYFCPGCDCDFYVKGAFRSRIYFCNDCKTELIK